MSFLGRLWSRTATQNPLVTLSFTNGAMGAVGDIIAQQVVPQFRPSSSTHPRNKPQYDPWRTLRFFAYGCMFGPVAYKWYSHLDRRFPLPAMLANGAKRKEQRLFSAAKLLAVSKRVMADQILFAPVAIGGFFVCMGVMEGKSKEELADGFRDRYPQALMGNYVLWPAAQFLNFSIVPLLYRVPFSSLVSVLWNTFLSIVNDRESTKVSELLENGE